MLRQFYVKVYKADNAFYLEGETLPIYCNHVNNGPYGINQVGEITTLPESQITEIATSPPSEIIAPVAGVPHGTIWPSSDQFVDGDFKAVTKIKDMVTLSEFYVDTADYNSKVVQCNPAGTGAFLTSPCPPVAFQSPTVGQTTFSVVVDSIPGSSGFQYVNNQSASTPTSGSITTPSQVSYSFTGLTPNTSYWFWIRTICAGGNFSVWGYVAYTTLP